MKKIIDVNEKVPLLQLIPLSFQHTFAMFGASVLVPIVMGINPSIVLFMNGIGTLFFIFYTKQKSPAYLGSSFAFIGPATIIINSLGFQYAQGAFVVVGLLGCLLAFIIKKVGIRWIDIILPPAAMGSVVSLIGFQLAGTTVQGGAIGANIMTKTRTKEDLIIFFVTLSVAVLGSVLFKKFFATIPILIAIIIGYTTALFLGKVDLSMLSQTSIITPLTFQLPRFNLKAIITMLPVLLVIISEHISHQVVTSNIIKRDLLRDPGLDRTIFADSFSSTISGLIGGVPTTTYGENIGVMAITKVYSVYVLAGAAIISMIMAFIGPISVIISSIPGDVIGGVTFLLYGMIGTSGIRLLVDERVNYSKSKNLILTSVIFISGLSGLSINLGGVELSGMVLASVVAVILSSLFYLFEKFSLLNE